MGRILFALAAVAVASASVADYLAWRASHRELSAIVEGLDLTRRAPEIVRDLRRETAPHRAATLLAWSLLQIEVDRAWTLELSAAGRAEEAIQGLERLRTARRLATETLPRRPASWQAAAVLGASRHLEASRGTRTEVTGRGWREPLEVARSLAPGHPEPALLLAAISLSRWSSLSRRERDETVPLLATAFAAPDGLDLLLPQWLRLAPSLKQLLEPIPDQPAAWQKLGRQLLQAGDLERFAIARERWLIAMPRFLTERTSQAIARRKGGDARSADRLLRSVVAAPHDLSLVDSFSSALSYLTLPITDDRTTAELQRWLAWTLDLCAVGSCPLSAETLQLLARAAEPAPSELAMAFLATENLEEAQRHEGPASGDTNDSQWNRYWIFKAHRLASSDPERAKSTLARAAPTPPDELRYWRAAERLAMAAGDDAELDRTRARLAGAGRQWSARKPSLRVELLAAAPATGLRLRFDDVRPEGAAIECSFDGRSAGVEAVFQPGAVHRWQVPIEAGLHLLEIHNLTGRILRPSAVTLEPAARVD